MSRWSIELTPEEEARACAVGFLRQFKYLATPEANRRFSMGDTDEIRVHSVAAGAEIAWAKMLGVDAGFIPSVNTWKSEPDVGEWEVRWKQTNGGLTKPSLRFSGSVDSHKAPYVLMIGGPEQGTRRSAANGNMTPPYEALGWCYPNEVMLPQYIAGEEYGLPTYSVPPSALRSMSELE